MWPYNRSLAGGNEYEYHPLIYTELQSQLTIIIDKFMILNERYINN